MVTQIGKWLEHFDMDAKKASEETGIGEKTITRWVNGTLTPSVAQLNILSKHLGVLMDDLIETDPDTIKKEEKKLPLVRIYLKEWFDYYRLKVPDVAKATTYPEETIEEWLTGEVNPDLNGMKRLAVVFGIPTEDLLWMVQSTPKEFYERYLSQHYLETRDYKTIARLDVYLNANNIPHNITVYKAMHPEDNVYMVKYTAEKALEPLEIMKIKWNWGYYGDGEKYFKKNDVRAYDGWEIIPMYRMK